MTDYEKRLDENIEAILRASGSSLRNYTMPSVLSMLRAEMRAIMVAEYIAGSDAAHKAMMESNRK